MFLNLFENKDLNELFKKAELAIYNMEYKKALGLLNNIIKLSPKDKENQAVYYFYRALVQKNLKKLTLALADINKAIELEENLLFYLERAEIQDLLNVGEEAEKDRETAFNMMKNKLSDEDYVEALKVLNFPKYERTLLDKYVNLYLKLNSYINAAEIINDFLAVNPNKVDLLDVKTDFYVRTGLLDLAILTVNRLIELMPKNGHYYLMCGGINYTMRNFDKANEYIEKAMTFELNEEDKKSCLVYKKCIEEENSRIPFKV